MGQGFNFKFDELRDGNPTEKEAQKNANESFAENSHVRNLCLVWPDGKRKFFNYAYLVSGEFSPDQGSITLAFTSETVVIKGVNVLELFDSLLSHLPKQIVCTDNRYKDLTNEKSYIVNEIQLLNSK